MTNPLARDGRAVTDAQMNVAAEKSLRRTDPEIRRLYGRWRSLAAEAEESRRNGGSTARAPAEERVAAAKAAYDAGMAPVDAEWRAAMAGCDAAEAQAQAGAGWPEAADEIDAERQAATGRYQHKFAALRLEMDAAIDRARRDAEETSRDASSSAREAAEVAYRAYEVAVSRRLARA